jgi:hypothetical protein
MASSSRNILSLQGRGRAVPYLLDRVEATRGKLLNLLKISHEEYLKLLEEFQRKEKTYEQAITEYQRKLFRPDRTRSWGADRTPHPGSGTEGW